MDYLLTLNPQQREAVTAPPGPILVLAGPGSGKTRVLTYRVAYLIGALGVRPFHILAVTFTNKAAREMENRIIATVGAQARGVTIGTFHATCARILRREADHLPFDANFVIADTDDQRRLIKNVLQELNLDPKQYAPQKLHAAISRLKNEGIFPENFEPSSYGEKVLKQVYEAYQNRLLSSNLVDFDDLLLWTLHLLQTVPAVRQRYARRFQHILVDEFQDTNLVQYELVRLLGSHYRNIFVVGDADQSIYSWRGADYRNVLRFEQDFPDAKVILLEQNYRSTQTILDAAMAVIAPLQGKHRKQLFTSRGAGQKIAIRRVPDDREEARYVVETIASLVARGQAQPGDFAIMYRINAQSRVLEEAFLRAGLPYRLVGAQRFYGRREVKDALAYLRLAHNPADEPSLMRVINVPPRGIGTKTIAALRTAARRAGLAPGTLLLHMAAAPEDYQNFFSPRALKALLGFARPLAQWYELALSVSPADLMATILADVGYKEYLLDGTEEGEERWENVRELHRLASRYNEEGLSAFLEEVTLVSDQDTLEDAENTPILLTLHAAKGLEFPHVFIVGLVEGLLPHSRAWDNEDEMAEERRLFYVGLTRAKDQVYLTYPEMRMLYGYAEPAEPSRFLEEIPPELTTGDHPARGTTYWQGPRWEPAPAAETREPEFHAGDKVRHPRWGEGLVIGSRIKDGAELVDVAFESVGLKRLDAALARLEKIT
ncbi:MAG: UvrD-helicase domain-containing protein [Chloroflexi bacterium]|nr:UvrD-helicase domain-containing protein [Chloroflexota bacterium]